jgi:protein lin-28
MSALCVCRCYNCGNFANHIAARCPEGPLPKRCHHCKSSNHLIADCPLRAQMGPVQQHAGHNGHNGSAEHGFHDPSMGGAAGAM